MSYSQQRRSSSSRRNFGPKKRFSGARRGPKKESIHPSKFIQKATTTSEIAYQPKHSFEDFPLAKTLAGNLIRRKFSTPSPIQDQTILPAIEGRDIIGIADTGTGKTLAFALPVLHKLIMDKRSHALIIAPTRELAEQILTECKTLIEGEHIRHALLIGGMPMYKQFKELSGRPQLVIGTPGRIKDHLERETIALRFFNLFVLDEVDRMLDMGFVKDIQTIMSKLAPTRQSFFFSATMVPKVRTLIDEFSNDPLFVSVKTGSTSDHVEQNVIHYSTTEDKWEKLTAILEANASERILIFEETKRGAERLGKSLISEGFSAEAIHGNKSQPQRKRILEKFRAGKTRVLVATDVAARGIDVADIAYVINYSTPNSYSDYVHRIGRAGRAGKTGFALTFLPSRDGAR
jgi:superfamily II DNA/RNA helicase